MDYDGRFIMQKTVDWSLLNDGKTIPVSACSLLKAWDESILTHEACKGIKVLINGKFYDAKLKNHNFAQSNWPVHKDVIHAENCHLTAPLSYPLRTIFKIASGFL